MTAESSHKLTVGKYAPHAPRKTSGHKELHARLDASDKRSKMDMREASSEPSLSKQNKHGHGGILMHCRAARLHHLALTWINQHPNGIPSGDSGVKPVQAKTPCALCKSRCGERPGKLPRRVDLMSTSPELAEHLQPSQQLPPWCPSTGSA